MARKKSGPNKSQAIRDLLSANPDMAVRDVVANMSSEGMKVTPNLVYFIKGKMKSTKRRKKRVVRAATAAAGNNGVASKTDAITMIREVKALAEKAGGYAKLKELVDALAN